MESDLWEQRAYLDHEGASATRVGVEILGRTARGVADDIRWRLTLEGPVMTMKIGLALVMLALLAVDFLEFHDVLEAKTVPEYLTGAVSVPVLLILFGLVTGVVRLTRTES
jgi:hypothetical protein